MLDLCELELVRVLEVLAALDVVGWTMMPGRTPVELGLSKSDSGFFKPFNVWSTPDNTGFVTSPRFASVASIKFDSGLGDVGARESKLRLIWRGT